MRRCNYILSIERYHNYTTILFWKIALTSLKELPDDDWWRPGEITSFEEYKSEKHDEQITSLKELRNVDVLNDHICLRKSSHSTDEIVTGQLGGSHLWRNARWRDHTFETRTTTTERSHLWRIQLVRSHPWQNYRVNVIAILTNRDFYNAWTSSEYFASHCATFCMK